MILFLDDDVRALRHYRDELLRRGYDAAITASTDDGVRALEERGDEVEVVVLDVMMPPGPAFEHEDTELGVRTGELFYREFRRLRPSLPVVVFTNRHTAPLSSVFGHDPRCKLFMKEELLPWEFADMLEEFARPARSRPTKEQAP